MKPIHIVFSLLLVIAGITVYILTSEPPANAAGVAHQSLAGIKVGGDGAARLATIGKAPFYFQIAVIFLAASLLYMGVPEHRRDRLFRMLFAGATAYAVFVWVSLFSSYQAYHETGVTDVVFGFPVPTNWFLWGVWSGFVVFDLLYVFAFRRYFLHPEDEQSFRELVAEVKSEQGDV
ncbi:MAG: hypothetical protein AB3N28_08660 [Kordiimonas sp.]